MIYPRETIELQEGDRKLDFGKKELPIPETDEERALFRLMGYLVDSNGTIDPDEFGNVNLGSILAVYGGNITTLKAEILLLKESIEEIIAAGKEEIGEDKTAALEAMSNKLTAVLDSIDTAKGDALTAIGTDNDTGARKQAIDALDAAKEAALKAIGKSDSEGARKDALASLDAKLTEALQAIGRTDSEGARKAALDAIAAKLTKALEAIAGKETAIDEKVEQASQKASDADSAAALARKWASEKEDVPVLQSGDIVLYSAFHYMMKAQKLLASPLADEDNPGRVRYTDNPDYTRPEGMTDPVVISFEKWKEFKDATQEAFDKHKVMTSEQLNAAINKAISEYKAQAQAQGIDLTDTAFLNGGG